MHLKEIEIVCFSHVFDTNKRNKTQYIPGNSKLVLKKNVHSFASILDYIKNLFRSYFVTLKRRIRNRFRNLFLVQVHTLLIIHIDSQTNIKIIKSQNQYLAYQS